MSCCRQSGLAEHCSRYNLFSSVRFRPIIFIVLTLVLVSAMSTSALAASVEVGWDENDPIPDGYIILIRAEGSSYNYDAPVWVGSSTSCRVDGLVEGTTYFMVVRAYNGNLQSPDSDEISFVAGQTTASRENTGSEAEKSVQALNLPTVRNTKAEDNSKTVIANKVSSVTQLTFSLSN